MWKGHLSFGLVTIPVKVYSAVEGAAGTGMHMLHEGCLGQIGYEKKCKACEQVVPSEQIVKGVQIDDEQWVVIAPGELAQLKLKSTKTVEIEAFCTPDEIPAALYENLYYIGPDGPASHKGYSLLHAVLLHTGKVGIGKVTLRDREAVVMVSPYGPGLAMYMLRYAQEVRDVNDVDGLDQLKAADPKLLAAAQSVVESMEANFDDLEFRDGYADALKELVESKIAGKPVAAGTKESPVAGDIMEALKASIARAKKKAGKKGRVA